MNRVFILTLLVHDNVRYVYPHDTMIGALQSLNRVQRVLAERGMGQARFSLRSVPERLPNLTR